jgi:Protein of unknown function (DUF2442)
MKPLPSVIKAEYVSGYVIRTFFDDGVVGEIDFTRWLDGGIFKPLREKRYFRKFFVDGSSIAWPNGADIAPETLYEAAISTDDKLTQQPKSPKTRKTRR